MARKNQFDVLHDAFAKADNSMKLTPEGNGGFALNDKSLMPSAPSASARKPLSGKPQTPAQHSAVEKAAKASVMKRKSQSVRAVSGSGLLGKTGPL